MVRKKLANYRVILARMAQDMGESDSQPMMPAHYVLCDPLTWQAATDGFVNMSHKDNHACAWRLSQPLKCWSQDFN